MQTVTRSIVATHMALPASAQTERRLVIRRCRNATTQPLHGPAVLTGKERLGKKWMDEQRIDNCKVPIDKLGAKPRPSTCPQTPSG
jgi:hypothetical protein